VIHSTASSPPLYQTGIEFIEPTSNALGALRRIIVGLGGIGSPT
jgi:hypothetical protein